MWLSVTVLLLVAVVVVVVVVVAVVAVVVVVVVVIVVVAVVMCLTNGDSLWPATTYFIHVASQIICSSTAPLLN